MKQPIHLELGDYVEFNDRIFKVAETKISNGQHQGHRVILKLLDQKELHKMLLGYVKGDENERQM